MATSPATPSSKQGIALRGLVALAVAMGIGRFAFTPQLPVMQADLGLSLHAAGWLAGANYLGYLVGAVLAGRSGACAARLMRWGLALVVAGTAAMAVSGPLVWWLAMRFIAGAASAWVLVGTASVVLARLAEFDGARLDGVVFAGVGAGIALAGLVCHAGLLAGMRSAGLWMALAVLALAGVSFVWSGGQPAVATEAGAAPHAHPASGNARGAWRLVLCYGLFGFGYILPATYLPSQARALLDDPALFGWVWPIFGLAAALSTLAVTVLARWPRKHAWAAAQLIMAAGVLLPILVPGLFGLALAALCVGGTFMLITLLGLQEVRHRLGPTAREWLAAMTAAFAVGQLAGPLIANALMGAGWPFNAALWLAVAALVVSSGLLVFTHHEDRIIRRKE